MRVHGSVADNVLELYGRQAQKFLRAVKIMNKSAPQVLELGEWLLQAEAVPDPIPEEQKERIRKVVQVCRDFKATADYIEKFQNSPPCRRVMRLK